MRPSVLIRAFFLISFHFSTIASFIFCYVFYSFCPWAFDTKTLYTVSPLWCHLHMTISPSLLNSIFVYHMSQKNSKDNLQNATKATEEKHPLFTGGLGWSLVCVCVSFSRIPPSLLAPPRSHFCHGCHGDIYTFYASPTHCRHICLASVTRPHNERRFSA